MCENVWPAGADAGVCVCVCVCVCVLLFVLARVSGYDVC